MKKILVLGSLFFAFAAYAFSQNEFQKIKNEEISQTDLRLAASLAEKMLAGQKSGKIYLLSEDEAIPQVVKGLTESMQISSYELIRVLYGDFESLNFAEGWQLNADQRYTIYRFRGNFSESEDRPEIRVVLNEAGKLSGFWIRPWEDNLNGNP